MENGEWRSRFGWPAPGYDKHYSQFFIYEFDMSSLTLREATADEALAIVAVLRDAFEEYRGRLDPPSGAHAETVEKIHDAMRGARVVLALEGGAIAGCVFYAPVNQHVDLFRLGVLPAYRRRGVGQALISYVEAQALVLGFGRVRLGVRVALPDNRAYYERLGYRFVEARSHAGYARPTFVILEKVL
jgi:GNAT superfamily N-acetyltransferase